MTSMVWPCFAARVPMAVAMFPEPMMLMVVMMNVPPWCLGELGCRRGAALEFEVVSGWVTDEHRVVVRCILRPQPRFVEDLGTEGGDELVTTSDGRLVL